VRTLVLGGVRSGKSAYAESLLANAPLVRYVATARAGLVSPDGVPDADMAERIRRHAGRRPPHWETVEAGAHLERCLTPFCTPPHNAAPYNADPAGADLHAPTPEGWILVDGLTLWLATLLEDAEGWGTGPEAAIASGVAALGRCQRLIVVSEEVGWGSMPAHPLARRFGDLAGELNQRVAALCEHVVLVAAGLPLALKGGLPASVPRPQPVRTSGPRTSAPRIATSQVSAPRHQGEAAS